MNFLDGMYKRSAHLATSALIAIVFVACFALGKYADSTQAYQVALDTAPSTVDVSPIRHQHRQSLIRQEAL